jgi:hypothetical protein
VNFYFLTKYQNAAVRARFSINVKKARRLLHGNPAIKVLLLNNSGPFGRIDADCIGLPEHSAFTAIRKLLPFISYSVYP